MCGIVGICTSHPLAAKDNIIEKMLESISHRGRDNRGVYYEKPKGTKKTIGVGHNRLSVIDLSKSGNQPFEYKNLVLTFNGEIYNYMELKSDLGRRGYSFDSESDTEVIVKLYHCYGLNGFKKMNGMFALSIYDKNKNIFILVRDRLGVKPLYYFNDEDMFLFSSEMKSFKQYPEYQKKVQVRRESLASYFKYGYVNSFNTVINLVKKVENGTILTFKIEDGRIETHQYWSLSECSSTPTIDDEQEATEELYEITKSSASLRLVSDVPVGLYLSSGIDSNLVLNLLLKGGLQKLSTITLKSIDYEENNLIYDNRVSREYLSNSIETIWSDYKYLCTMYDEPFADPATIGLYQLSKYAAARGLKVVMVGDGGDEILAGYSTYKKILSFRSDSKIAQIGKRIYQQLGPLWSRQIENIVQTRLGSRLNLYHSLLSSSDLLCGQIMRDNMYDTMCKKLIGKTDTQTIDFRRTNHEILDLLNYKTNSELVHYLNYKTDIAGMLNTVEIREPLLDYRLFEFQQRISLKLFKEMITSEDSKVLFRSIMKEKLGVDLKNVQKKGFHVNIEDAFLRNTHEIEDILNSHVSQYLDMNYALELWRGWLNKKVQFLIVFRILSFILWEDSFINGRVH
jgi:asparagine synthase (glutamine-hydrolysing)